MAMAGVLMLQTLPRMSQTHRVMRTVNRKKLMMIVIVMKMIMMTRTTMRMMT